MPAGHEMTDTPTIVYTKTDEAPALATYSFLPIARAFAKTAGVTLELRDISLAGRILSQFGDHLAAEHRVSDALAELGELTQSPTANIIKLPNISASVPQLEAAIKELQSKGFALPDYPIAPSTDEEREIAARYQRVKGSAVNPVLREGNSDRRAPKAVKEYAKANPHSMGAWTSASKSHVATMQGGDFRSNEQSTTIPSATTARIEFVNEGGEVTTLKSGIALEAGEIIDATRMDVEALTTFLAAEVRDARESGILFSLHMKATMMKVSDPIIFGHAVRVFFKDVFDAHGEVFDRLGVNVNNGLGDLLSKIEGLPASERDEILAAIDAVYAAGPSLAMVDSDRGI
ncbi:MAG: NADP-dependent isocitrate dehydrogenase, partial [Nannocystaceae bacterium]